MFVDRLFVQQMLQGVSNKLTTRIKGFGYHANLPLISPHVNTDTLVYSIPLYFEILGSQKKAYFENPPSNVTNVTLNSVQIQGLNQAVLTTDRTLFLHFAGGSSEKSLKCNYTHNLTKVPINSLPIYYFTSNNGTALASFGGDPVQLLSTRQPIDNLTNIKVKLIDGETGNELEFSKMNLILNIDTLNAQ